MNTKKKGMTLIELLIVIAILSIVLSAIGSFFFTNYKTLNLVNKDLELQAQGERAINFLVDNIIDGYSVETKPNINSNEETVVSKLVVEKKDNLNNKYYGIFQVKEDGKLYYASNVKKDLEIDKITNLICSNKVVLKVKLMPNIINSQDGDGVKIVINLKSDKLEKEFINEVYLRNKTEN